MQVISPSVRLTAFSCPHCNAYTSQTWAEVFAKNVSREAKTPFIPDQKVLEEVRHSTEVQPEVKQLLEEHFRRLSQGELFSEKLANSEVVQIGVNNLWLSKCFNCGCLAVWVHDRLVYPQVKAVVLPNPDLPDQIRQDFEEARGIVDQSPRGAAALLRLAIQKLCSYLGENDRNIDQAIASLVKKGLNPIVQQALDVVRVIGNEAVHPGVIDLRDDRETAQRLFELVNLVANQMITQPKSVQEMYARLPASKLDAIQKRDGASKT